MNWKTIYRHNFSHSFSLQKPPSRIFFFATRKFWKYLVQFFLVGFSSFLLSDYTSLLTNPIFLSKNSSLAKVMMKKEKKLLSFIPYCLHLIHILLYIFQYLKYIIACVFQILFEIFGSEQKLNQSDDEEEKVTIQHLVILPMVHCSLEFIHIFLYIFKYLKYIFP